MILSLIFWCIGSIFNAVKDTLSHHFSSSVFSDKDEIKWNPIMSWRNKYINGDPKQGRKKILGIMIPVFFTDWWHRFKTAELTCYLLAVVTYPDFGLTLNNIIAFFVIGIFGNLVFNLFYGKILRR